MVQQYAPEMYNAQYAGGTQYVWCTPYVYGVPFLTAANPFKLQ